MSGISVQTGKKSSSRTVATKKLIIDEYKRRLKDNIRSLSDNFNQIIQNTKINVDEQANKLPGNKMTEFYVVKNEMSVRAALIARACDELLKLTNDLKEFLVLHDFNFLTHAIKAAEEECDLKMNVQIQKHNEMRFDVTNLLTDLDREYADNYTFRH
ncbi:unnamed protein product [Auanema sp. JU1783]|nr:unnamed protein product [Auanema sp. JU1783]